MSIITCHWSVSAKERLGEYHIEFMNINPIEDIYNNNLLSQIKNIDVKKIDWNKHMSLFQIFKNYPLTQVTTYGTWHLNSDPRDSSSNIEIASLTMAGNNVQVQGPWGSNPHTISHSLVHAYIVATICKLKNINPLENFPISIEPSILQNGPIYIVSTHGERALQTNDDGQDTLPALGYFIYSGDADCRWDLAALDPSEAHLLSSEESAILTCKQSANWIRNVASELLKHDLITNYYGLDK